MAYELSALYLKVYAFEDMERHRAGVGFVYVGQ